MQLNLTESDRAYMLKHDLTEEDLIGFNQDMITERVHDQLETLKAMDEENLRQGFPIER
jgi:hypothetical protein